MKKTKNLEEFTRDLSFKLPRTVTGSPETRRKWRFSDDPWLPPSLLCSASLLLLLLLCSGKKQKEWKKKQLVASMRLEDGEGGDGSVRCRRNREKGKKERKKERKKKKKGKAAGEEKKRGEKLRFSP